MGDVRSEAAGSGCLLQLLWLSPPILLAHSRLRPIRSCLVWRSHKQARCENASRLSQQGGQSLPDERSTPSQNIAGENVAQRLRLSASRQRAILFFKISSSAVGVGCAILWKVRWWLGGTNWSGRHRNGLLGSFSGEYYTRMTL